jgi:hypothetical protein
MIRKNKQMHIRLDDRFAAEVEQYRTLFEQRNGERLNNSEIVRLCVKHCLFTLQEESK